MVAENQPTERSEACLPHWIQLDADDPYAPRVLVSFTTPGGAANLTNEELGALIRFASLRYGCAGVLSWDDAIEAAAQLDGRVVAWLEKFLTLYNSEEGASL